MSEFVPTARMEELMAEIMAKMDAMSALWYRPAEQSSPPPSTSVFTSNADFSSSLCSASPSTVSPRSEHVADSEYSLLAMPDLEIESKPAATSLIPSPTSAPPQEADLELSSGVTELPTSTDNHLCIVFDADGRGGDRISCLPDSLICDIVSRLPIKDATRMAVLSRRWSLNNRAAPLLAMDDFHHYLFSHDLNPAHKVSVNLYAVQRGARDDADARNAILGNNPTTNNLLTVASASPTPSRTSNPSQEAILAIQFGTTKLLYASPTKCSTLSFNCSSSIFASDPNSKLQISVGTTKPLLLLHIRCSMLDTPAQYIINSPTAMVERYCCTFALYSQSFRPLPWPPWVFATVIRTCGLLISPLSLLRPPDASSSSCKPCIDSNCAITFDPGISYLSTYIVMSTTSDDQAMSALMLWKEHFRGIIPFQKSREEFLATTELDMLTSKFSPQYVRCFSEINDATILSIVLFEFEVDESKLHWLHLLESAAQVDDGNIRGVSALSLYNLYQIWLFTDILAAVMSLLLIGGIHLIKYFWSQHPISFSGLTPYLVWASLLNLVGHLTVKTELSLVQLLGVMPNFILKLAGDYFACMRAMGCIEALHALKRACSISISCESGSSSVIQASKSVILIAAAPHPYMQNTVCLLPALSLNDTSQQFMVTLAISWPSTTVCFALQYASFRPVLSVGMDNLCFCTNICAAHEMFQMGKLWTWIWSVLVASLPVALAARIRAWMAWCCFNEKIRAVNLLAYSNGQLGRGWLHRLLELVESAHISSLITMEWWQSVASVGSDNCRYQLFTSGYKWSLPAAVWEQIDCRSMVSSSTNILSAVRACRLAYQLLHLSSSTPSPTEANLNHGLGTSRVLRRGECHDTSQ